MFRKYALRLLLLLAGAMALASTGHADDATDHPSPATKWASAATQQHLAATLGDAAATAHHFLSTVDDYTTQAVLMQEEMMLNLLNQDRKNNGLPPLKADARLSAIARIKSADMRDENYFAHQSPTYGSARDMLTHFGYPYRGASENIAHHANVPKAQAAFMSSAGHRRNILGIYWEKVGIGIVFDDDGFIYATQLFVR